MLFIPSSNRPNLRGQKTFDVDDGVFKNTEVCPTIVRILFFFLDFDQFIQLKTHLFEVQSMIIEFILGLRDIKTSSLKLPTIWYIKKGECQQRTPIDEMLKVPPFFFQCCVSFDNYEFFFMVFISFGLSLSLPLFMQSNHEV